MAEAPGGCLSESLERGPCSIELFGRKVKCLTEDKLLEAGIPWPAQQAVARWASKLLPKGCSVVELGSGCGALACALALEGHRPVVATDLASVVPLMEKNVQLNGVEVECRELQWGDIEGARALAGAGAVIACEVAYAVFKDLFADDTRVPLANTLDALIGEDSIGIFAFQVRDSDREASLLEMFRDRGLELTREEPAGGDPDEGEVGVWSIRRLKKAAAEG
eukprot:gnl/TRDRNA2_/TRDRNA2_198019_c0_seq1.p1 gnl/TRDRNA2_/TRDRNA2_198019_c0~~gnl/TRDRNA2_/TRDRNA2_198019_c0_seq1.p1  ORF type:complete len:229 (+),score=37.96 gnl/TRDRNA2_/TRDRNA2_198019_c0_seq1:22-687(+)